MPLLRILLLALFVLAPTLALAYDVLLLQSVHDKGYDEAVKGFRHDYRGSVRRIVLTDYAELDLTRITREEHPKLIVAVGDRALELAQRQNSAPVLYMMALSARPRRSVSGVSMLLDPVRYLSVFEGMGVERVGVLYDPARSGTYLKRALAAASRNRVKLVLREVHAPKETPAMLASLTGKVEALWMLPDATAVSPASTEAYFLFSQAERVPVVTFAEVYLSMGGAVALTIDRYDIGRQLAEMAQSVLEGKPVQEGEDPPRRIVTKSNEGVVRQLKLNFVVGR